MYEMQIECVELVIIKPLKVENLFNKLPIVGLLKNQGSQIIYEPGEL